MHAAQAPSRTFSLDPKRIAATSAAICVHVAVLMLLMMPAQLATTRVAKDTPLQVQQIIRPIEPIPLLHPTTPIRQTQTQRPPINVPVQVAIENSTPSPVDPYVEQVTIEPQLETTLSVDARPSFALIRADFSPAPPYPAQAIARRLTGEVMLRVLVDETGKPVDVAVETSSGVRMLDEAALKFVLKRWHFVPATQDGRPIQAYALVPINFVLQH